MHYQSRSHRKPVRTPRTWDVNGRVVNAYRCGVCGTIRHHIGPIDRDDWAPVKRCYSDYFKA